MERKTDTRWTEKRNFQTDKHRVRLGRKGEGEERTDCQTTNWRIDSLPEPNNRTILETFVCQLQINKQSAFKPYSFILIKRHLYKGKHLCVSHWDII